MTIKQQAKQFLTFLVVAPIMSFALIVMAACCLLVPFAILIWPDLLERKESK